MRVFLLLFLSFLIAGTLSAQVNYNDVAVIINSNDSNSIAIGAYFKEKRNIPASNIIEITAPSREQINFQEFQDIRQQIEAILISRNIAGNINYIVTTKGVPLGVARDTTAWYAGVPYGPRFASFDSELTLILGTHNDSIGNTFSVPNPYYNARNHFSRNTYSIYLVTRLDGYTVDDVKNMIDRSGPNTPVNRDSTLFVLDQDPVWDTLNGAVLKPLHNRMGYAAHILQQRGFNTLHNTDEVFVTGERNVLGYNSWGSNDHFHSQYTVKAKPGFHWAPGSIAETYVSTSARTFIENSKLGSQSLIADLIREGVTAVKGYVYEPFAVALADVSILFDIYTDTNTTVAYNMAEAFYMSSQHLSWMDVVIGDPKTSLDIRNIAASSEGLIQNNYQLSLYPNPASSYIILKCRNCIDAGIIITDMAGKTMLELDYHEEKIEIGHLQNGIYLVKISSGNNAFVQKLIIHK